jgi:hypothetical protein
MGSAGQRNSFLSVWQQSLLVFLMGLEGDMQA